jgi:hypothetical protein
MQIFEMNSQTGRPLPFTIFGTDISTIALKSAKRWIYNLYSVRNTEKTMLQRCFIEKGGLYAFKDVARKNTAFDFLNLINSDSYRKYRQMDMIFCRNVLICFDEGKKKVQSGQRRICRRHIESPGNKQDIDITRIPNAPPFVEGVINLRGKIIPIVDFRQRLGFAGKEHDKSTGIIVIELDCMVLGFIVNSVSEVLRISNATVKPPPRLLPGSSPIISREWASLRTGSSCSSSCGRFSLQATERNWKRL